MRIVVSDSEKAKISSEKGQQFEILRTQNSTVRNLANSKFNSSKFCELKIQLYHTDSLSDPKLVFALDPQQTSSSHFQKKSCTLGPVYKPRVFTLRTGVRCSTSREVLRSAKSFLCFVFTLISCFV